MGCLSRIPNPDFYPSRIPDPTTAPKRRGEKYLFVLPYFVATNIINWKFDFIFEQVKKIVLAKTLRIIVLFT